MSYFSNLRRGILTTAKGLSLTLKHLFGARNTKGPLNVQDADYFKTSDGYVTLQYPHEEIFIPENGRNQLHNEIDDCIVCDKCAKICPVDCIDIIPIKSPDLIRNAADGSPVRLYAEKFDIDMAKCCFCGLCTTVCPTDCLTMNNNYDYSVIDVRALNYEFSNLTPEEAQEKKTLYENFVAEKNKAKEENSTNESVKKQATTGKPFIPTRKPVINETEGLENMNKPETVEASGFRPKLKPPSAETEENKEKPKFIPKQKPTSTEAANVGEKSKFVPKLKPTPAETENEAEKPKFVPKLKPSSAETENEAEKPKFVPKLKPTSAETENDAEKPKFVPKLKPTSAETQNEAEKPKFVPKLKPTSAETENDTEKQKFVPKLKPTSTEIENEAKT